ncbi:MAG TPA: tRNA uridine-5-carboxymethylaminomethyl(34) synthesis GTPase MnmE [Coxiellaceae bacterium]|nr:MAG: tRNA uridine-5-carboxymethylaminomethyl(34) synthesis GTPase MnmE [Gammaproteobacteria bacterium RIFCSPHIGHO2_12_FULL_36_30]HLB55922.1 tRNA uridine-5-carboxymethylaminomethyl(34) synthesis GTPase MnmE [Coxiellaceae bacterium]
MRHDTIAAIATPSGRGGVGIIRISGKDAKKIALKIIEPLALQPRTAYFTAFYDINKNILDEGIVLFFENPHSFTGEDVVELQSHGSPIVLDKLLKTIIHYGARIAKPGEFSERAFLNKKIDLTQAEAIADLIAANSEQAARSAVRSLQGEFSKKIHTLLESLINLRMQIEAMIDFPEEEIDFLADPRIAEILQKTIDEVEHVKNQAKQGVLLQNGLHVVIAGKPNAGKSSLLNYLSGRDSAIVTDIPGTTRDILRESISLDGLPLHIIDTAGLRETNDAIEQEGVRRAREQMQQADLILLVVDASEIALEMMIVEAQATTPILIVRNKIDLTNESPVIISNNNQIEIKISIKNNSGLDLLTQEIKKIAGFQSEEADGFIARHRHVDAIERAHTFLLHGQRQLMHNRAGELLAEDLRQAQQALSEITGEFTSDDLLGKIFSNFCIGK